MLKNVYCIYICKLPFNNSIYASIIVIFCNIIIFWHLLIKLSRLDIEEEIKTTIKNKQLQLLKHLMRMHDNKQAKKILKSKMGKAHVTNIRSITEQQMKKETQNKNK